MDAQTALYVAKATCNNLRLKAYYWEKQLKKGRADPTAAKKFKMYSEQLEAARADVEVKKQDVRDEREQQKEKKALEWRKNIRRNTGLHKAYDQITQKQIDKRLESWNPSTVVSFD